MIMLVSSIGFDMREKHQPWLIVAIDCIAGLDSLITISANIGDFIEAVGIGPQESSGE
jgi:hypothetical protein